MSDRAPTMRDVAARADVALKTVSRYVNGATNINPELAERIRVAIAELDYRPNLAAASLRPGRSAKVVGLVIGDLANPYWSGVARAVERVCSERGYLLVTASSDEDPARHELLLERLVGQQVDGLIVVPPRRGPHDAIAEAARRAPLVAIDRPSSGAGRTVLSDNAGGAEAATRALLPHGRVAFLGDSLELWTMRERHDGHRRVVAGTDSAGPVAVDSRSSEDAAEQVAQILDTGSADAVFAANNRAAIGALMAFRAAGRRLPLIGFDDFEAATLVDPAVSVVAQDVAGLGRAAAETLFELVGGGAPDPQPVTLPTALLLRGSERASG